MIDLQDFDPDGEYLPTVKLHSVEKLKLHNYYGALFAAGMAKQWPNLVYLGLYSGAGAAYIEGTNRTVMTSALSVLTQPVKFTHYVFVDEDLKCIDALRIRAARLHMSERVELIAKSVNASIDDVVRALPDYRLQGGVLTFCFIDPFRIDLDFTVLRRLAAHRIDILLMVPLGYDIRRNWQDYVEKVSMRDRLTAFLGESNWIDEWASLSAPYSEFPRFIQGRLNMAMSTLGFIEVESRDIRDIKVSGKNVYLYSLHLFSKSPVAIKFWRDALKGTSEQHSLDI